MSEHNIIVQGGTTTRLLTAGKYCDRDIIVTAEGGSLALDVVTATALPDTVVDGQIVVITETAPGTVYIDTDEPGSPVSGDVWIKLEAGADVVLEMTEGSPYLRSGLTEAKQWDGSAWNKRDGFLGTDGNWEQFAEALPPVGTALNDMSWEDISKIASKGLASTYFSIGDAKEITINGVVGTTNFVNIKVWAVVLGFNHNSLWETENSIQFQIGTTAETAGTPICLTGAYYSNPYSSTAKFVMTTSATTNGGWENCHMRKTLLGNDGTPSNPLSDSFMAALPSDLLAVMKGVTKYTDNVGGGSTAESNVTSTTDYLWLPAEYEVFGVRSVANNAEQKYQQQYEYYAAGNNKIRYKYNSTGTAAIWWLRSTYAQDAKYFRAVSTEGKAGFVNTNYSYGIAPCFAV